MNEKNYTDLIAQYLSGRLSKEEETSLMEWVDADANNQALFDEMLKVWSFTGKHVPQINVDTKAAWNKVSSKLATATPLGSAETTFTLSEVEVPTPTGKGRFRLLRIAAAIVLLLGATYWYLNTDTASYENIIAQTQDDERKEIVLPDGSTVWLNQNSQLAYNEKFEPRVVELTGEAFFNVEKMNGLPFQIVSGEAKTTVLGTSFNVRAYAEEQQVEVTVETGKVALEHSTTAAQRVLLLAGESGTYDKPDKKVEKTTQKILNANAWQTRTISFNDMELTQVIDLLERYFEVEIKSSPEINRCVFTTNSNNPKLQDILDAMAFGLELKITPTDKGYQLTGEGCR